MGLELEFRDARGGQRKVTVVPGDHAEGCLAPCLQWGEVLARGQRGVSG